MTERSLPSDRDTALAPSAPSQNAALTPLMMLLTAVAMPRRPVDPNLLRRTDWPGIVYAEIGFGLVYAGLDQGNGSTGSIPE
jgi:hypothetical protein